MFQSAKIWNPAFQPPARFIFRPPEKGPHIMRSLDGGSLHDSTKSPKNRNPRFRHSKNRKGTISQPSGRVRSSYMARLKAEIALDNIPTHFGRVEGACTFTFEVLCPAKTTSAPENPRHQNRSCTLELNEQNTLRFQKIALIYLQPKNVAGLCASHPRW